MHNLILLSTCIVVISYTVYAYRSCWTRFFLQCYFSLALTCNYFTGINNNVYEINLGGIIFPMLWMHKCYLMIKILSKKILCFILQEYLYLQDGMIWTLYVLQCISNLIHVMCPRHCLIILLKICYAGYFSAYHTFTEFLLSPCFGLTNGTCFSFKLPK